MKRTEEQKLLWRRKLHARRVFNKNPMFAIEEISVRYPGYCEDLLLSDIKLKSKSKKTKKKKKSIWDFRRRQLDKYAGLLKYTDRDSKEYHDICIKMVMLEEANRAKSDIALFVKLGDEKIVYSFAWTTKESHIKDFIRFANSGNATHEGLRAKQKSFLSLLS